MTMTAADGTCSAKASTIPAWRLTKVHHLGLTVADLERSSHFYQDILGMTLVGRRPANAPYVARQTGYPGLQLEVASFQISPVSDQLLQLAQYVSHPGKASDQSSNRPGNTHLCLQVDDLQAAYRDLLTQGVQFKSEPVCISAGPNQGGMGVYLLDPDGFIIEFFQPPEKDAQRATEGDGGQPGGTSHV